MLTNGCQVHCVASKFFKTCDSILLLDQGLSTSLLCSHQLSWLEPSQAQRVGYHGEGADRHGPCRQDRVQESEVAQDETKPRGDAGLPEGEVEHPGGDGDEGGVVGESPEEVLLDSPHGSSAQGDGGHDASQIAADQGDLPGL